jgi:DNA (cytosine-5)-methyltransferase 1
MAVKTKKAKPAFLSNELDLAIITHYEITKEFVYKNRTDKIIEEYSESYKNSSELYQSIKEALKVTHEPPFLGPKNGEEKFTFIDLFAGIGGFRMALQNLGGKCVFSSEWDKAAKRTYFNNYGEVPFGDITNDKVESYIPKSFNILCAGFPCQPFSKAGVSARNYLGLDHGFDHPTQGNLFFEIIRLAVNHTPDVLFLENVKNLKSHDEGNTFKVIEKLIREIGYSFYHTVINSKTEVPQRRERTYMVCFKDKKIDFKFPEFSGPVKVLRSILEENVDDKFTISNKLWEGHQNRTAKNIERGTGFTAFLADLNKPSNTLVARYGKDGKECLIPQEGKNPRKLTPRECARLQGYPEMFKLPDSSAPAYKQFGNSVSVPVIEKIANNIIEKVKLKRLK